MNLIPSDPLTIKLLVEVLAKMIQFEMKNHKKETEPGRVSQAQPGSADDAPAEPETPTVGGKE